MILWLIFLIVVTLSGCTAARFTHPNYTAQLWNTDSYECERDARQSGYFGGGIAGAINMQNFRDRCLIARGWTKEDDSSAQPAAPRSNSPDPLLESKQKSGTAGIGPDAP